MRSRLRIVYVLLAGALLGLILTFLVGPSETNLIDNASRLRHTEFEEYPFFIGVKKVSETDTSLRPFALALHGGRLLVSYLSSDRVDEFSENLEPVRTFRLFNGERASITGLAVSGDRLYAADFLSGELLFVEYATGKVVQAFGLLADKKTRMKAIGVTHAEGNLYVTDVAANQILVVSASTVPNVRDEGELILSFPSGSASDFHLRFPGFSAVTPDGRLLVGDVGNKEMKAFTCSGRPAHKFENKGEAALTVPMGIAQDDLPSPKLQARADTVFNPSGVFEQGRIHVVDAVQARVKVFDALGSYVLSYGKELRQPNGIAIDRQRRLIFVADAQLSAIALYRY